MTPNPEKPNEKIPLESLHPDFSISVGGSWMWNRNPSLYMEHVDRKVMFFFSAEDLAKLGDCPSVAKIGNNLDTETATQYPYTAFVYGNQNNSDDLVSFARKFSNPQMIESLTSTWVSRQNAKVTKL